MSGKFQNLRVQSAEAFSATSVGIVYTKEYPVQGICRLCQKNAQLKMSHFIPKFVGEWVKKTSITGYIRDSNEVHKRAQDIAKEYWLCAECEGLFSDWEGSFAKEIS